MPETVTGGHKDEQNRVPAFQELSPEDGQTLCPGPSPALPQLQVRFWDRPRVSPLLVDSALTRCLGGGATADPAPGCFSCPLCLECGKIPTGSGLGGKGSWAAAWIPRKLTRKGYLPFVSILYVSISLWEAGGRREFCLVLGCEGCGSPGVPAILHYFKPSNSALMSNTITIPYGG